MACARRLLGGCQLSCTTAGCRLADLLKHFWLQCDTCRHHNAHDCYFTKPVHHWLQLLSCGPREHEKVAAALQDDRRQSVKTVKALEEELAAMQGAALASDYNPGQQELRMQAVCKRCVYQVASTLASNNTFLYTPVSENVGFALIDTGAAWSCKRIEPQMAHAKILMPEEIHHFIVQMALQSFTGKVPLSNTCPW